MAKDILILDGDEAFALMLRDSIKREMGQQAAICTSAAEGKRLLAESPHELAIIDLGIEDEDPIALIRALRRRHNGLRIIVIPLMGEDLPDGVSELDIQGVLTKPFFIGDLAGTIELALNAPITEMRAEPAATPPGSEETTEIENPPTLDGPLPSQTKTIDERTLRIISDLHRELTAQAVILSGPQGIAAQSGKIRGMDANRAGDMFARLSGVVSDTLAACAPAGTGGETMLHQGYVEALDRRLYWISLDREHLLVCVLDTETPLGMLRYHLRRAAAQLKSSAD